MSVLKFALQCTPFYELVSIFQACLQLCGAPIKITQSLRLSVRTHETTRERKHQL
jgi:hypothetical protein